MDNFDNTGGVGPAWFIKSRAGIEFVALLVLIGGAVTGMFLAVDHFWLRGTQPKASEEWQNIGNFLSVILGIPVALAGSIVAIKLADTATAQSKLALELQKRQDFSEVRQEIRSIVGHSNDVYFRLAMALGRAMDASHKAVLRYRDGIEAHVALDDCREKDACGVDSGAILPVTPEAEAKFADLAVEIDGAFVEIRAALYEIMKSAFTKKLWVAGYKPEESVQRAVVTVVQSGPQPKYDLFFCKYLDVHQNLAWLVDMFSGNSVRPGDMIHQFNKFLLMSGVANNPLLDRCTLKRYEIHGALTFRSEEIALAVLGKLLRPDSTLELVNVWGRDVGEPGINVFEGVYKHVNDGAAILCDIVNSMPNPEVVHGCLAEVFSDFAHDYDKVFHAVATELDATGYLDLSLRSASKIFSERPTDLISTEFVDRDTTTAVTGTFFEPSGKVAEKPDHESEAVA